MEESDILDHNTGRWMRATMCAAPWRACPTYSHTTSHQWWITPTLCRSLINSMVNSPHREGRMDRQMNLSYCWLHWKKSFVLFSIMNKVIKACFHPSSSQSAYHLVRHSVGRQPGLKVTWRIENIKNQIWCSKYIPGSLFHLKNR